MRRIYFFLLLFLMVSQTAIYAQALQVEWLSTIPGDQFEENNSLAKAPCGDIYTVGFFQNRFGSLSSFGANSEDGFITKYNELGQLQWVQQLHGSSTDRINGIAIMDDNSIYISGEFRDILYYGNDSLVSNGRIDAFVAKLDSSGQFLWAFNAGYKGDDSAYDMDILHNGTIVITGHYEVSLPWGTADTLHSNNGTSRDVFVAGISPMGTPLWASALRGAGIDICHSIATDTSNCFYIMGSFRDVINHNGVSYNASKDLDAFLVKYNSVGQLEWLHVMGGDGIDEGRYVTVDAAQNIIAGGWAESQYFTVQGTNIFINCKPEEDAFAVKYAPDGSLLWANVIGSERNAPSDGGFFDERIYGIGTDEHNNIYFVGTLDSLLVINGDSLHNRHFNRPTNIFVLKYASDGTFKWGQTLGHYNNDYCYDLIVESSSELFLVGTYQDTSIFITDTIVSAEDYDMFIAKFKMDTILGIRSLPSSAPQLEAKIFPNPSTQQSILQVNLDAPAALQVVIYDVLGQVVYQETTDLLSIGEQQLLLCRQDWPAGTYFVYLQSDHKAQVLTWVLE